MEALTELLDEKLIRTTTSVVEEDTGLFVKKAVDPWKNNADAAQKFAAVPTLIADFLPTIESRIASEHNPCRKRSWELLRYHADYMTLLAKALKAGADGDKESCAQTAKVLFDKMKSEEDEWESDLDLMLFLKAWTPKFKS